MTQPASPREVRELLLDLVHLAIEGDVDYVFAHDHLAYGKRTESRRTGTEFGNGQRDGEYQVSDPTGSLAVSNAAYKRACERMVKKFAAAHKRMTEATAILDEVLPEATPGGSLLPVMDRATYQSLLVTQTQRRKRGEG